MYILGHPLLNWDAWILKGLNKVYEFLEIQGRILCVCTFCIKKSPPLYRVLLFGKQTYSNNCLLTQKSPSSHIPFYIPPLVFQPSFTIKFLEHISYTQFLLLQVPISLSLTDICPSSPWHYKNVLWGEATIAFVLSWPLSVLSQSLETVR